LRRKFIVDYVGCYEAARVATQLDFEVAELREIFANFDKVN